MTTPIETVKMGTRLRNVLLREGHLTLESLGEVPWTDVLDWRNCGIGLVHELRRVLKEHGLALKTHDECLYKCRVCNEEKK